MGFFSSLIDLAMENDEKKKKAKDAELNKKCDIYGLDDYERELVKKGDYEPDNFEDSEEEDLDEDDYYYEK